MGNLAIVDLRFDANMWVCRDCIANVKVRQDGLIKLCGFVDPDITPTCDHCGGSNLHLFRGDCNNCVYGNGACVSDEDEAWFANELG